MSDENRGENEADGDEETADTDEEKKGWDGWLSATPGSEEEDADESTNREG